MKRIEAISHVIKELKTLKEELGSGKSISTLDFLRLSEVFKFQIEPKSDRFTAVCLDEAAKIQDDEKHLKMIDDILRDELDGDDRQAGSRTGAGHYFKRYYGESIEELGEHDMSEVLGFEDTEFKDAEETIEYFEKEHDMDEIEATERAESMGKTSGLDKKGQQRLTEKERLKKLSEDKAKNMIEVLLSKKEEGREISSGQNSLLDIKIKQLFKLASVEGVSQEELLKKIKSFNE